MMTWTTHNTWRVCIFIHFNANKFVFSSCSTPTSTLPGRPTTPTPSSHFWTPTSTTPSAGTRSPTTPSTFKGPHERSPLRLLHPGLAWEHLHHHLPAEGIHLPLHLHLPPPLCHLPHHHHHLHPEEPPRLHLLLHRLLLDLLHPLIWTEATVNQRPRPWAGSQLCWSKSRRALS